MKNLLRSPFLGHNLLYIYHKLKNRHLVKFWWSSMMSRRSYFEGLNMIGKRTHFSGSLGYGSSIGDNSLVNAIIGKFTSIGPNCTYINATHPYKAPFATTCSLFYSLNKNKTPGDITFANKQMFEEFRFYDKDSMTVNKIGSDCWLGANVTLIGGVCVGDGAVVLSKAIVTKDVPPYAIVGGIPAKIIGYRYDSDTIEFLMNTKWWENSNDWFKKNWELLCDIDALKEYYKK